MTFDWLIFLKAVDTIGNCQRLGFTVGVSQHMHKTTNLWKFELNRSSKLRDNNERRKQPSHTKLCAFRWLISRPQFLNLRSRNQIRGKLLLSRKLLHFRGSSFSQCFLLPIPTSPHYSLPSKILCKLLFWVTTNSVFFKNQQAWSRPVLMVLPQT